MAVVLATTSHHQLVERVNVRNISSFRWSVFWNRILQHTLVIEVANKQSLRLHNINAYCVRILGHSVAQDLYDLLQNLIEVKYLYSFCVYTVKKFKLL